MEYLRDTREQCFVINDAYLNGYAKLCGINATGVYMSLCRHADKEQKCFPSKKLMAQELAISERSVYNAIKSLELWGIIKRKLQGRKSDGSFLNATYFLVDKKHWKPKPTVDKSVDKSTRRQMVPSAGNDNHRRHLVPNKDTHKIKDTHSEVDRKKPTFEGRPMSDKTGKWMVKGIDGEWRDFSGAAKDIQWV